MFEIFNIIVSFFGGLNEHLGLEIFGNSLAFRFPPVLKSQYSKVKSCVFQRSFYGMGGIGPVPNRFRPHFW